MFDQRFYKKCSSSKIRQQPSAPSSIETLVEAELISLQSETGDREPDHDIENEEFYGDNDKHVQVINAKVNNNDGDDAFYDNLEKKMDSFSAVSLIATH